MRYGNFSSDPKGLGELLRGAEMQAHMLSRVERGKAGAEADAPVGPASDPHRGEYRDSFSASVTVEEAAPGGGVRAVGRLTNKTPYAVAVEYGTGGRSAAPRPGAHHTMTRSIDAMKD